MKIQKNFFLILIFALSALFLFSCQKNSSDNNTNPQPVYPYGNGQPYPQPNGANNGAVIPGISCMNGSANCNSQQYSTYPGFYPYPVNPYTYGGYTNYWNQNYHGYSNWNHNYAGLCNCPAGTVPTYNNYYGLGCVQNTYFQPTLYYYGYFGWGPNNNQWVNIPQVSNLADYSVQNQSCYSGIVQSCYIDVLNSCSNGYTCQPTSGGSRLGLCINPNQNYNSPYNNTGR